MTDMQITTYTEPRWGSKANGTAMIRKDRQAGYYVNDGDIVDVRVVDLFTVLTRSDGATYNVLTAYLQQVDRQAAAE